MKNIAFLLLIFLVFSCSKDETIEQKTGTKLISIEYTEDNRNWEE